MLRFVLIEAEGNAISAALQGLLSGLITAGPSAPVEVIPQPPALPSPEALKPTPAKRAAKQAKPTPRPATTPPPETERRPAPAQEAILRAVRETPRTSSEVIDRALDFFPQSNRSSMSQALLLVARRG